MPYSDWLKLSHVTNLKNKRCSWRTTPPIHTCRQTHFVNIAVIWCRRRKKTSAAFSRRHYWRHLAEFVGRHFFDGRPIPASVTEVSHAHPPSTRRTDNNGVLIDRSQIKIFVGDICRWQISATNVSKCEQAVSRSSVLERSSVSDRQSRQYGIL